MAQQVTEHQLAQVRALTLIQPWAHAIAHARKRIECRGWMTRFAGPLLIHAGAVTDWGYEDVFAAAGAEIPHVTDLVHGAIVAVTRITGVCTKSRVFDTVICDCGPWAMPHSFHWQLGDVHTLAEPVPCRGRLQLWRPDISVLWRVAEQVPASALDPVGGE